MGRLASINGRRLGIFYLAAAAVLICICLLVQPGVYSGLFDGSITLAAGDLYQVLHLRAETTPQWHWARPRNHRYESVALRIMAGENKPATLDLPAGTWRSGAESGALDEDALARLVAADAGPTTLPTEFRTQIKGVLELLHDLRDGNARPPRHHSHNLESPVHASYQHFTSGRNYGVFAVWAWLGVWPFSFLVPAVRSRRGWLSPLRIYLLALAVTLALDGLLFLIGSLSSPGPLAELVELLLAMVNLPAWVVLGGRGVLSWTGFVFGALGWATLLSAGTLTARRA